MCRIIPPVREELIEMPYKVVLRRANGRLVKKKKAVSRYAAKRIREAWWFKYDETYQITIEKAK